MVAVGHEVVLTSEPAIASDSSGSTVLGFVSALPESVLSDRIASMLFGVEADGDGIAKRAPYGLAKVEAKLRELGIDAVIASPYELHKVIGERTRVVGIYTMDGMGYSYGSGITYWIVRQDRYIVDEQNHRLILRGFDLEINFAGRLRWHGKQGRLEIRCDGARGAWHASIPVEVGVETTRNGNESKHIVRGERKSIRIAGPRGDEAAGVDLGINILASAVTSGGAWLLYRGSRAKEDFFYLTKKIAEVQSEADEARKGGDEAKSLRLSRKKRRLFRKLVGRVAHLYWNLANHLVRGLWELGVSRIYLGYPHDIAQDNGNKLTSNMWRYRELMDAIELKAQEYGIRVYEVLEYDTSNHCAVHNVKVARGPRGVVTCPLGHRLHSDLNGALNILRRGAGSMPTTLWRPLSFLVDHGGVAPAKGA
jgi:putative transposase